MDHRLGTSKLTCLLLGAFLVCCAVPRAEANARPEPTPQMVADQEVAFMTFIVGEALTPEEQARVATAAKQVLADDHAVVLRNYAGKVDIAAKAAGNPFKTARLRYLNRKSSFKQFSRPPKDSSDVADAAVLAAHDPVIAYDATRDILFTRRSVDDLRAASAWVAGLLGIPGPSAAFNDNAKNALTQRLTTMDNLTAFRLVDVAQGLALAQAWVKRNGTAAVTDTGADARAKLAHTDPSERDWSLAVSTGTIVDLVSRNQVAYDTKVMMNRFRATMMLQGRMNMLNQVTKQANRSALSRERHDLSGGCMPGGSEDTSFCNGH